eukprot:500295_1
MVIQGVKMDNYGETPSHNLCHLIVKPFYQLIMKDLYLLYLKKKNTDMMSYRMHTTGGQSGSAVVIVTADTDAVKIAGKRQPFDFIYTKQKQRIIGIHTGGDSTKSNWAVRIKSDTVQWIEKCVKSIEKMKDAKHIVQLFVLDKDSAKDPSVILQDQNAKVKSLRFVQGTNFANFVLYTLGKYTNPWPGRIKTTEMSYYITLVHLLGIVDCKCITCKNDRKHEVSFRYIQEQYSHFASWIVTHYSEKQIDGSYTANMEKETFRRELSSVRNAYIASFREVIRMCICGATLERMHNSLAYANNGVICDGCRKQCTGFVYHCTKGKCLAHSLGYDLCDNCILS